MQVSNTTYNNQVYTTSQTNTQTTSDDSFQKSLDEANSQESSQKQTTKSSTNSKTSLRYSSLDEFFTKADKAGGVLAFLQKENQDKIKEEIEKKKAELEEKYGLNKNPPLQGEALKQAQQAVNDALDDFKKELMKKLKAQTMLEKGDNQNLTNLLSKL